MLKSHNLGFPRIGRHRELKFALESYWKGSTTETELANTASQLQETHLQLQAELDLAPIGDFSYYDQVLDTSFLLGNVPPRVATLSGSSLDSYFRVARGRAPVDKASKVVSAGEMTKWFNTNYHYIVPEFHQQTEYQLHSDRLLEQVKQARQLGINPKPVIIGPITYLSLGKTTDNSDKLAQLDKLLPVYHQLLQQLAKLGVEWVQIDEPILVTDLSSEWCMAFRFAYQYLQSASTKLLLTSYFGELKDNLDLAAGLPVDGVHIDCTSRSAEAEQLIEKLTSDKVLSLGIVDGRNIWKTDLNATLDWLQPLLEKKPENLWIAPSCSLLHSPVDLDVEQKLAPDLKRWLAFATQKIQEVSVLQKALIRGKETVKAELASNARDVESRKTSSLINRSDIKHAVASIKPEDYSRKQAFAERISVQNKELKLPRFPTTTIGSFPQTDQIRAIRKAFKFNQMEELEYLEQMRSEITHCVKEQEALGLDVLVHGEAERNDMVEYFGEQLDGFAFTQFGWVQSYGSRCVKPPILYGDVSRNAPMTVKWTEYAQSLSDKWVKGMLTGPVTILNWSFVRDDLPRSQCCQQVALAIRDEVKDLEAAGIRIIQIDEPALREGLPLRKQDWKAYLDWAVKAFRLSASAVEDNTQIHTHMCYAEFNDIISAIAELDADVITIETSRSNMELLDVFDKFSYPNDIGPGVYDIHSPNTPDVEDIVSLIKKASTKIPSQRLWVNPDCGLKTRSWEEVRPALQNMVLAAQQLRSVSST